MKTKPKILVIDNGLFFSFAQRLAAGGAEVSYWTPNDSPFPTINGAVIGDGFDNITRVRDVWDHLDVDVVAFPDVGMTGLQTYLENHDVAVWGSRTGSDLELKREWFNQTLEVLGLKVPPHKIIIGLDALRPFLQGRDGDCYVKISRFRGMMETFHHVDYGISLPWLDQLAVRAGPLQNRIRFIVYDPIETKIETGLDTLIIDGVAPTVAIQGIERKDKAYAGVVTGWLDLPKELTDIVEQFMPIFKEQRYRNFFSSEVRVDDNDWYFTDPTCRMATPAGEPQLCLIENLVEIVEFGANGDMIEPKFRAKFAAQALIDHPGDKSGWRVIEVPATVAESVFLYSPCQIGAGVFTIPPFQFSTETVGSAVGLGDTLKEAIENLQDIASELTGQGLTVHTSALVDVLAEMHEAESKGIPITDQPIPAPSIAIDHD
jgi:hypothetical protein